MKKLLLLLFLPFVSLAQGYTSYFTGNPVNISVTPTPGTCLMGGATEHDNAMIWLLERANGGDVVVLRSSGSNGYNNYLYSELGVNVNSVETLVITSTGGAVHPYVLDKVANAELIWFAGGDQWNYVSYFKDNALEDLINDHISVKHAPIGGTSAGMAILGSHYFSAAVSSVTSATALANPYAAGVTIGSNDFIDIPFLSNTITDTHFDNPDRRGRLAAFLGRIATDENIRPFGIAANEYVAICIDEAGKARVFGEYPAYDEFAYFVQANCQEAFEPEQCVAGQPLVWNRDGEAMKVYKVPGTMTGENYIELSDWSTGMGGEWLHWTTAGGSITSAPGSAAECVLSAEDREANDEYAIIYPNPARDLLHINSAIGSRISCFDIQGQLLLTTQLKRSGEIDVSLLRPGLYLIIIENGSISKSAKFVKS